METCQSDLARRRALSLLLKVENYSFLQAMQELSELSSPVNAELKMQENAEEIM